MFFVLMLLAVLLTVIHFAYTGRLTYKNKKISNGYILCSFVFYCLIFVLFTFYQKDKYDNLLLKKYPIESKFYQFKIQDQMVILSNIRPENNCVVIGDLTIISKSGFKEISRTNALNVLRKIEWSKNGN